MRPLLALTIAFFVQTANAQTDIAIKGGWNLCTARVYQNGIRQPNQYISGFGLDFALNIPFEGVLYFSPVIGFSRRGYQYEPTSDSISLYHNTISYLDLIPALSVHLPYKKNTVILSVGPQFSLALSGTEKTTVNGITSSNKMQFAIDANYGIIDLGLNLGAGLHLKKFLFEATYQYGCANINNNVFTDGRNIQNRMLSFNIGYFLN